MGMMISGISKKGITPIIAVILLLLMTVVAGAATMVWFQKIQTSIKEQTEESIRRQLASLSTQFEIVDAYWNSTTNGLVAVTLVNKGSVPLDVTQFTMNIYQFSATGSETRVITRCSLSNTGVITVNPSSSLSPGDMYEYVLDLTACGAFSYDPAYVYYIELIYPNGAKDKREIST